MTKVIFKKFEDGDILAIFPEIKWNDEYLTGYQHIGQHGGCSADLIEDLDDAQPDEYAELFKELIERGYNDMEVI